MVVASRARASLGSLAPVLSVLADRENWVHRDYEKVMRDVEEYFKVRVLHEEQIRNAEKSIGALRAGVAAVQEAKDRLDAALAQREGTITALNADLAARNLALAEKDREIDRRRGWRWWLKLPLIRLGLLK